MNDIGKEELKGLLEMGSVPVCRTLYNLLGKRAKMTVTDIKKVGMDDIDVYKRQVLVLVRFRTAWTILLTIWVRPKRT